jgi:ubiquinone/menaquinone biosynthesis C-methylase UbiE
MKHRYDPEVEGQYHAFMSANPIRHRWHLNKLRLFELAGMGRNDLILDAGCGAGNLVFELAPRCRAVIGCDVHHGRLTFAAGRGRGVYVEGAVERLPFGDQVFDKIFCLEVVEHIQLGLLPDILREFHRVLRRNGKLVVTTPNYRSLWPIIEFFMETFRLVPRVPGGDHVAKYDWRTLEDALVAAGFAVNQIGTFNLLSPFAALLSDRWAERLYQRERGATRAGGHLLYALCERP